jgi:hypothetical protein
LKSGLGPVKVRFDPEPPFDPGHFLLHLLELTAQLLNEPPRPIEFEALIFVKLIEPAFQKLHAVPKEGQALAIPFQPPFEDGKLDAELDALLPPLGRGVAGAVDRGRKASSAKGR